MTDFGEIKKIVVACNELSILTHGGGASPHDIDQAADALGVDFCGQYREFLGYYGWIDAPTAVFGLGDDVPPFLELVRIVVEERTIFEPRIPANLIPICNDGWGNHYCLTSSTNSESRVLFWSHDHELGEHQSPEVVAECFFDWLLFFLSDDLS